MICSNGPPCVPGKTAESRTEDKDFKLPLGDFSPSGLS